MLDWLLEMRTKVQTSLLDTAGLTQQESAQMCRGELGLCSDAT